MDSAELSRKVAEAMGWRECATLFPELRDQWGGIWHSPGTAAESPCGAKGPTRTGCDLPITSRPFDLADARDRESAIAWWKTKTGGLVSIMWLSATVAVWFHPPGKRQPIFSAECPTIEEAFGRALLAAMGVQG